MGDYFAVIACEGFLEVYDVGVEVTEDVDVAGGCGEGDDHSIFFDEGEGLLVDGGEGRGSGHVSRMYIAGR